MEKVIAYAKHGAVFMFMSIFVFPALFHNPVLADPGLRDTIRVGSIEMKENRIASVPVYFFNDEPISAALVVLKFDREDIIPDTFTLAGGRFEDTPDDMVYYRDSANFVELAVFNLDGIESGTGLLCNLSFRAGPYSGGESHMLDSAAWPIAPPGRIECSFSDMNSVTILPEFVPGYITVIESYMCGDVDGNKLVNLSDILYLISYLYIEPPGPAPVPIEAGDVDGNSLINLSDILYLIKHLYVVPPGPAPICPD